MEGHPDIWRRDLGSEPVHWAAAGGFPPRGGAADLGETTLDSGRRDLGIPHLKESMREVSLEVMEKYISRHQNMVAQYIVAQNILEIFLEADQRMG